LRKGKVAGNRKIPSSKKGNNREKKKEKKRRGDPPNRRKSIQTEKKERGRLFRVGTEGAPREKNKVGEGFMVQNSSREKKKDRHGWIKEFEKRGGVPSLRGHKRIESGPRLIRLGTEKD